MTDVVCTKWSIWLVSRTISMRHVLSSWLLIPSDRKCSWSFIWIFWAEIMGPDKPLWFSIALYMPRLSKRGDPHQSFRKVTKATAFWFIGAPSRCSQLWWCLQRSRCEAKPAFLSTRRFMVLCSYNRILKCLTTTSYSARIESHKWNQIKCSGYLFPTLRTKPARF